MNILPKKRWHVRTKENIARVRKDEAEAAENERQEKLRIECADKEARLCMLKQKSKQRLLESGVTDTVEKTERIYQEHINLFEDFDNAIKTTNKEHEKEVKDKREDYEKKIGYLTYLGQDTNEALGKKNWYEVPPDISRFTRTNNIKDTYNKLVLKDDQGNPKVSNIDIKNGEIGWKVKQRHDPMATFKKHNNGTNKIKDKKCNDNSFKSELHTSKKNNNNDDKNNKLKKLREARHKREQQEKYKTELFLKSLVEPVVSVSKESELNKMKPKYNSQFNPELARQNYR